LGWYDGIGLRSGSVLLSKVSDSILSDVNLVELIYLLQKEKKKNSINNLRTAMQNSTNLVPKFIIKTEAIQQ